MKEIPSKQSGSDNNLNSRIEKSPSRRVRRKNFVLDLRLHSPASLGYFGLEGIDTAMALVSLAKVKRLDVIAVTDFYSGKFIDRVVEAAKDSRVRVIPGVDLRCVVGCCEDIILTCLFPEETNSSKVENFLNELKVPTSARGNHDFILRTPLEAILAKLDCYGGAAFPSRVDKTPQRLATLRTLVDQYGFRAFDLAYPDSKEYFAQAWPRMKFQLFTFSSANSLAQVGSRTFKTKLAAPEFESIRELVAREQV